MSHCAISWAKPQTAETQVAPPTTDYLAACKSNTTITATDTTLGWRLTRGPPYQLMAMLGTLAMDSTVDMAHYRGGKTRQSSGPGDILNFGPLEGDAA